ncbi:aminoacyl-tRNA deacylase [Bailinhaonella thermotolerans]|uniref:YbaK/aminoacyl-tRNA synthetase-associated domain-containing protein n=1 Tax=Bailinhaonella thermotolerans TaxID=1070861 RepID=A0A3A4B2A6_9ACTN|nr:YbaK/EbsC family protein [Bailinhaonella thermotolerans]RJL32137.1 hypothetical protein D5H75_17145 [Bailinhaonella thermotolerans]
MKDALVIHRWLLAQQAHHEIVRLPRPLTCADDLPKVLGIPPLRCVSVGVFATGREFIAVMTPAGTNPLPEAVGAAVGARRVRAASCAEINEATEYSASFVGPLLLPEDVSLVMDQRLLDVLYSDEVVYCATGESHTALGIRAFDLFTLTGAKPVELTPPRKGSRGRG